MGFTFRGFFARCENPEDMAAAAYKAWPKIRCKIITEPFYGLGASMPDLVGAVALHNPDNDKDDEALYEELDALEEGLPAWSRNYPGTLFVYVFADCFGGTCLYEGYLCKNGKQIKQVPASVSGLEELLSALGVAADKPFQPLTRNFFE